jgi:hypothetical protein
LECSVEGMSPCSTSTSGSRWSTFTGMRPLFGGGGGRRGAGRGVGGGPRSAAKVCLLRL